MRQINELRIKPSFVYSTDATSNAIKPYFTHIDGSLSHAALHYYYSYKSDTHMHPCALKCVETSA